MKTALTLVVASVGMALASHALAENASALSAEEPSAEANFAQCVFDKDPALAGTIKDAPSQEAFVEALKRGATLCETKVEGMSLGRLFKALNHLLPDDPDAEGSE